VRRVVLDPGVLVSGFISPAGAPARLLLEWLAGGFELVVSRKLLDELDRVLARPRFRRYATESEARAFVALLRARGIIFEDPSQVERLTRDPHDDYLIALAAAADASAIVSGDADLTELSPTPVAVLTPRAFLDKLARS
jgi:putative PIN family toxin of toxin-antitoxin system